MIILVLYAYYASYILIFFEEEILMLLYSRLIMIEVKQQPILFSSGIVTAVLFTLLDSAEHFPKPNAAT